MAVTPQTNEAFLREVDEELRRDQAVALWRRWGRWLIGGVVAALVAFAGVLFWQNHQQTQAGAEGAKLLDSFDLLGKGDTAAASKSLADLSGSSRAGYRALAKYVQADLALQKQDLKSAAAIFAAVAGDASLPSAFRDLALIRQTSAEFDKLQPSVVLARMKPLAVKGAPWFGSAGELLGIAYLQAGQRDAAAKLFATIAEDENTPETLRTRAAQMAGSLKAGPNKPQEDAKPQ